MRLPIFVFGCLLLTCGVAFDQSANAPLSFEVASVKLAPSSGIRISSINGGPGTPQPELIRDTNVSLLYEISRAYAVENDQVAGPDWLASERYEIVARVPMGATKEQVNIMMQNLLKERFNLAFRSEKKDLLAYQLNSGEKRTEAEPSGAA